MFLPKTPTQTLPRDSWRYFAGNEHATSASLISLLAFCRNVHVQEYGGALVHGVPPFWSQHMKNSKLCKRIEYHALNHQTIKHAYPMARYAQVLDGLRDTNLFPSCPSVMDSTKFQVQTKTFSRQPL
jgi:hypothetical protein